MGKKVTKADVADFFRGCTNPAKLGYRLILLLLICLLSLGSYYSYDIPGAIGDSTIEDYFNTTSTGYGLVYSIYSVPNMVLAFIGGILLDKVGLRFGSILFCALVLGGQIVVSVGSFVSNIYIVYVGRAIFGLGGESLTVSQNTYTAKWFKGRELAFAFGVVLSFSRIGSAINFDITPNVEDAFGNSSFAGISNVGVPFAFTIGSFICLASFGATLTLALLDKKGDKALGDKEVASSGEPVKFKEILHFPLTYWIINAVCVTFYVTVFVFIQFGNGIIMEKWLYPKTTASPMVSIPYTLAAASSFIFGFTIDRVGRSAFFVTVSCSLLTTAMAVLAFTPGCPDWEMIASEPKNFTPTVECPVSELAVPWIAMVIVGIAYTCLAAALWPSVALIIDDELLGSAYGLMTAVQNIGLFVGPILAGMIIGGPERYRKDAFHPANLQNVLYFFFGIAGAATGFSLLLMLVDKCKGQILNASASVMKKRRKEKEAQLQSRMEAERISLLRPKQIHNMRNAYLARLGIAPAVDDPTSPSAASTKSPEWPVIAEVPETGLQAGFAGDDYQPVFTPR